MNKSRLIQAAMAGALLALQIQADEKPTPTAEGKIKHKCMGGNACKSQSACHIVAPDGKMVSHCAGQNSCAGKGWIYTYGNTEKETKKNCGSAQKAAKQKTKS